MALRKSMRNLAAVMIVALVVEVAGTAPLAQGQDCTFRRGDLNNNGIVDFNDAVNLLAYIFIGQSVPLCRAVGDVNDNGVVEMGDYLYFVRYALRGGAEPPPPFTTAGTDPTPGTTIPAERDARFSYQIGEAIGFASNTGLKIPLLLSNQEAISGFQMVIEYNGSLLRIDEMLPDETALKEANPEYVIHQAFNRPGTSYAGYSALLDFATPFDFHTLPAGQNQLVGNIVVSISLIADPGETELKFVDGIVFPDDDPPEKLVPVENLVFLGPTAVRPRVTNGKVVIRKAFIRGDANQDKRVDISDPIYILGYVFSGGAAPKCFDATDNNNDSRIDISDPIFLLNYLFRGGPQPSSPFPIPGVDPDHDTLDCASGL